MTPETGLTASNIAFGVGLALTALAAISAALGGIGKAYYGGKLEKQKEEQSQAEIAEQASKLNAQSDRLEEQSHLLQEQQREIAEQSRLLQEQKSTIDKVYIELLRDKETRLSDELWKKYPYGYMLFGTVDQNFIHLPYKMPPPDGPQKIAIFG
jgi:uncharacterized protein HemX